MLKRTVALMLLAALAAPPALGQDGKESGKSERDIALEALKELNESKGPGAKTEEPGGLKIEENPKANIPKPTLPPPEKEHPPQTQPARKNEPAPRLSVPPEDQRTEAARPYQTIQSANFLKSLKGEEVGAIVKKLQGIALDDKKDPAERYVVFEALLEIGVKTGDAEQVAQAADAMGKAFLVDALTVKAKRFADMSKTVSDRKEFLHQAELLVEQAILTDNSDLTLQALDQAAHAARLAGDEAATRRLSVRSKEFKEIQAEQAKIKDSLALLASKPGDAEANFAAGWFYCLVKGDWEKGLPMLAQGSEEVLKALAQEDLAKPTRTDKQLAVGDGWWSISEKQTGLTRKNLRLRAARWYQEALPNLVGPGLARVERRLDQVPMPKITPVGRWQVTLTPEKGNPAKVVWALHKDGKVTVDNQALTGRWKQDRISLRIVWDKPNQWHALKLPLKAKDCMGASWNGDGVSATKISDNPAGK